MDSLGGFLIPASETVGMLFFIAGSEDVNGPEVSKVQWDYLWPKGKYYIYDIANEYQGKMLK